MADWTLRNLKEDVENSAERFGLAPGYVVPFGHRQTTHEEVYVVLAGSGRAKLDAEEHELRQWDALRVPPAVARGFAARPNGMELLEIGFGEGGDAETLEGFWDER